MRITAQARDVVYGRGAAGIAARLEVETREGWRIVTTVEADSSGRLLDWECGDFHRGLYRIVFDSDRYFVALGLQAAYPDITVIFRTIGEIDCQIQVAIAPYSYSTYFGVDG
jgi:5-hydroxyisourate hydrolase